MATPSAYTLDPYSAQATGEAIRFARRTSLEGRNQTPTASMTAFASSSCTAWPVQVTGSPITVDPETGEAFSGTGAVSIYPAVWLQPNDVGTQLNEQDEVWLMPFGGHPVATGDIVLARLSGRRPVDGITVYVGANSVTGSGTNEHVARWVGAGATSTLEDSQVTIDDSGNVATPGNVSASLGFLVGSGLSFGAPGTDALHINHSATSGNAIYVLRNNNSSNFASSGVIVVDGGSIMVNAYGGSVPLGLSSVVGLNTGGSPLNQICFTGDTGVDGCPQPTLWISSNNQTLSLGVNAFTVSDGPSSYLGTYHSNAQFSGGLYARNYFASNNASGALSATFVGISGGPNIAHGVVGSNFLTPDSTFCQGLLVQVGTQTFMQPSNSNTFTAQQTFQTSPGNPQFTVSVPTSNTSNVISVQNASNVTTFSVTGNGVITGNGSGVTNLNASNLASGTVPSSCIGTVDGGTW